MCVVYCFVCLVGWLVSLLLGCLFMFVRDLVVVVCLSACLFLWSCVRMAGRVFVCRCVLCVGLFVRWHLRLFARVHYCVCCSIA